MASSGAARAFSHHRGMDSLIVRSDAILWLSRLRRDRPQLRQNLNRSAGQNKFALVSDCGLSSTMRVLFGMCYPPSGDSQKAGEHLGTTVNVRTVPTGDQAIGKFL
jgi:hypothetical protein